MDQFWRRIFVFSAILTLSACSSQPSKRAEKKIGMPNPAAVYCVSQKGTLELRKDSQENVTGYCHLKNGKIVEEWEFFRKAHQRRSA